MQDANFYSEGSGLLGKKILMFFQHERRIQLLESSKIDLADGIFAIYFWFPFEMSDVDLKYFTSTKIKIEIYCEHCVKIPDVGSTSDI